MFEATSRYAPLAVKTHQQLLADGQFRWVRYVERRLLPPVGTATPVIEHLVVQGDRLDNLTARYLGDPTQFWRIADANDSLRPEELTAETARAIVIMLPQATS
jgi:nucleoid-associated protein YgaU